MGRKRAAARPQRTAREFSEDLRQAGQRMGAMSEVERLRWVVAFAQQPLAPLAPAGLSHLGNELRGLVTMSAGISYFHEFGPMPRAALEEIQARIRAALEVLVGEEGREVPMPEVPAVISRMRFQVKGEIESHKARFQVRYQATSETDAMLASVFELIRGDAGHQLHPCLSCGTPVVVNGRRVYCGPKCSQRVQDWLRNHPGNSWPGPRWTDRKPGAQEAKSKTPRG